MMIISKDKDDKHRFILSKENIIALLDEIGRGWLPPYNIKRKGATIIYTKTFLLSVAILFAIRAVTIIDEKIFREMADDFEDKHLGELIEGKMKC